MKRLGVILLVVAVVLGLAGAELARAVLADRQAAARWAERAEGGAGCLCVESAGERADDGGGVCRCGQEMCEGHGACPCVPSGPRAPAGAGGGAVHLVAVVAGQARVQREGKDKAAGVRHRPALWAVVAAAGRVETGRAAGRIAHIGVSGDWNDGGGGSGRGVLRQCGVLRL